MARHAVLDAVLAEAVAEGRVGQVVEIAAGMSPRGWRFTSRFPDLVYVEADLPGMAARKRDALERIGRPERHRVVEVDALRDSGPGSLAALAEDLDPGAGVAVITEGLLSYLPRAAVLGLWARIAAMLSRFPGGSYLSDLHVRGDVDGVLAKAFGAGLSLFVRGRVGIHFADDAEAEAALLDAGFASAHVRPASEHPEGRDFRSAELAHVIDART
jgi:O-methyltransferase involved in polyketide biosynthesis